MSKWEQISIGEFITFNPTESITKGTVVKKIPMEKLTSFERKIKGFEYSTYNSGPKFRNGDVLVAKITPCLENGKTAQVDILEDDEIAFGSSEFIVLRENERSINSFIFYLAKSPVFRERAISCMEGTSGRKRINAGALKRQEILAPNIPTQQRIASVLSSLDDKIELNNRINAELEAVAKTLYDYWFVQFDFPDVNGKPYKSSGGKMVYNKELKREIPKGWEVGKMADWIISPKNTKKIHSTNYLIEGDIPIIDQSTNFIAGYTNNTEAIIEIKDRPAIVFGDHTRILKLINFDFARGADGTQIIFSKEDFSQYLLYYQLLDIDLSNYGYARHYKFLKEKMIIIPKNNQPFLFDDKVKSIYSQIKHNIFENQHLASLRDWLLPMLMNGQVGFKEEKQEQSQVVNMAAELESQYRGPTQQNQRFELWLFNQGLAARGKMDKSTLREIFNIMDKEEYGK